MKSMNSIGIEVGQANLPIVQTIQIEYDFQNSNYWFYFYFTHILVFS